MVGEYGCRIQPFTTSHRQDSTYHGLCYTSRGALAGTRHFSEEDLNQLLVAGEYRCRVQPFTTSHRQDSTYHGLCYTSRGALAGTRHFSVEDLNQLLVAGEYRCRVQPFTTSHSCSVAGMSGEHASHINTLAAFTLPQNLARLNRAGLGPDLAHFSGTVYIATKTSSVDPSPVRGARLYVLPFYSFLVE